MGNIADLTQGNLLDAWHHVHLWAVSVWQSIPLTHTQTIWAGIGLGGLVLFLLLWRHWRYLKRQGKILLEPGKFGEIPGFISNLVVYIVARAYVRFMMGPVTVIGRRNLWYPGRLITFGPHISYLHDAPMAVRLMKLRKKRFFIAREEAMGNPERSAKAKGFKGFLVRLFDKLRTPILAFTGGMVVDRGDSQATKAAFDSAVLAMDQDGDSSFILFPEGRVREQAKLVAANHFTGAVRLLTTIKKQPLRRKFPWLRKPRPPALLGYAVFLDFDWAHATYFHRFVVKVLGFKNFRRVKGGTYLTRVYVCFGTPQDEEDLIRMCGGELNARAATDRLVARNERMRQHCIHRMQMDFGDDPGPDPVVDDVAVISAADELEEKETSDA